jgi:hypothetical protein
MRRAVDGRRSAENKSERAVDSGAGLLLPVAPERQCSIERDASSAEASPTDYVGFPIVPNPTYLFAPIPVDTGGAR